MPEERVRWNLFARELEDILATHHLKVVDLYAAGIYREVVRRLRHSLRRPGTFPLLNPDELARVRVYCSLSPQEVWRLRAAVVATAVQRVLYGRIAPSDALRAADELLPLLVGAVESGYVAAVWRHDDAEEAEVQDGAELESDLVLPVELLGAAAEISEALDAGALALHLSRLSHLQSERIRLAHEARLAFTAARTALTERGEPLTASDVGGHWAEEAMRGLEATSEQLYRLGCARYPEDERRDAAKMSHTP
jgi:hypothetical protein